MELEKLPYKMFEKFPKLLVGISPYTVDEEGVIVFTFMSSEVVNYAYKLCEAIYIQNHDSSRQELCKLMIFLEECANSNNPEVVEAVGTGFLHGLPIKNELNNIIINYFGDKTYLMLREQGFWPSIKRRKKQADCHNI